MARFFKFLFLAALIAVIWLGFSLYRPYGPESEKFVQLHSGRSVKHIAEDLQKAGIIRSSSAFLFWHYTRGNRSLKAGEYAFDHPATALEVYDRLARGDVYFHEVVIPEGFNMFEVARAIEAAGLGDSSLFLKVARENTVLIADIAPHAPSLEGYLFPDTYRFMRTQSMTEIVAAMVKRFRQEARAIGLTEEIPKVVILASIVEKETAVAQERPLVAGVFINRLDQNMLLGTDPSVIYAALLAGRYNGVIHQSDLHYESPYNTYMHAGLPPGPIANPGRASLLAALHPADTGYLYFVSDNHGRHRFASTMEEHNQNVQAYRHAVNEARPE